MKNYKTAVHNAGRCQTLDFNNFINVNFASNGNINCIELMPTAKTKITIDNVNNQIKNIGYIENEYLFYIEKAQGEPQFLDVLGNFSSTPEKLIKGTTLLRYLINLPISPYDLINLGAISSISDCVLRFSDLENLKDEYFLDDVFVKAIKEREKELYKSFKNNKLFSNFIVAAYYKNKIDSIIKTKIKNSQKIKESSNQSNISSQEI